MAYSVQVRTRELGVRLALGATPRQANRLLLRDGLALTLIGIALGLGAAAAVTRVLATLLFGVGALDLATFLGLPAVFAALASVACYLPARHVYRIDPISAINLDQ